MRTTMSILVSIIVIAATACGGGGNGGATAHAPVIANLSFSPTTIYQSQDGTASITGDFSFSDAGGDVVAVRMTTSAGADLTLPVSAPGITSGTLAGNLTISAGDIGHYAFEVWVTDSTGAASNRLSGTVDVIADDRAIQWTMLSVAPPRILYGIAKAGDQVVAVGAGGTVMNSSDLVNWDTPSSGVAHLLRSVAWSGSRFVAVGDDSATGEAVILSSDDAANWTVRKTAGECTATGCAAPAILSSVIWTGTQFVAVGQTVLSPGGPHALVLTSADGATWLQQAAGTVALGTASESAFQSVVWSGSQFVAVGYGPDGNAAAWTSADGDTWTWRTIQGTPNQVLRDLTWAGGRYVAVGWSGASGTMFRSTDGVTWEGNADIPVLPTFGDGRRGR